MASLLEYGSGAHARILGISARDCRGLACFSPPLRLRSKWGRGLKRRCVRGKLSPTATPPLRNRIAAAQALPNQSQSDDPQSAWSLLEEWRYCGTGISGSAESGMPKNALKRVSWEEQGTSFLIPIVGNLCLSNTLPLLQGITVGNLPRIATKIPQIAPQIRDPEGMLLTPEQRIERAPLLRFLSTALALALVNNGWKLHSTPRRVPIWIGAANSSTRTS